MTLTSTFAICQAGAAGLFGLLPISVKRGGFLQLGMLT